MQDVEIERKLRLEKTFWKNTQKAINETIVDFIYLYYIREVGSYHNVLKK